MPDGKKPWEKYSNNNSTPKPWEKYSNNVKKKESSQPTSQEDVWGSNSQPKDVYTSLVTDQQKPQQASAVSDGEQPKPILKGLPIVDSFKKKPIQPKKETAEVIKDTIPKTPKATSIEKGKEDFSEATQRARKESKSLVDKKQIDQKISQVSNLQNEYAKSLKDIELAKKTLSDEKAEIDYQLSIGNNTPEFKERVALHNQKVQENLDKFNLLKDKSEVINYNKKVIESASGNLLRSKAEQGNWFGAIYNKMLQSASSMASGAVSKVTDLIAEVVPSEYLIGPKELKKLQDKGLSQNQIDDYIKKSAKKDVLPAIRKGNVELFGDKGTTEEYIKKKESSGLIEGGVLGLAGSVPAMLGGVYGRATNFFLMGSDAVEQEMESNPDFKNVSENEKLAVIVPIGIANAVLEEFGLQGVMKNNSLVNNLVHKTLLKVGADASASTFKRAMNNEIKSGIAAGIFKVGSGFTSEAITGGSQQAAEIGIKDIYNVVKDKKMFQTPETLSDAVSQISDAAIMEGIGGTVMSTLPAINTAMQNNELGKKSTDFEFEILDNINENSEEFKKLFTTDLKNKMIEGNITKDEAESQLKSFDKMTATFNRMPKDMSIEDKKKSFDLLVEKDKLTDEINGKDESLSTKQKERISEINKELSDISLGVKPKEETVVETPEVVAETEGNKTDVKLNYKGAEYNANYQGYSPKTKDSEINIEEGLGLSSFNIKSKDNSFITGLIKGADFPGEKPSEKRGEVLNLRSETKGNGTSLMLDALYNMKKNGVDLVKFTKPSVEGKPFNQKLEDKGYIEKVRESESGTSEYRITDKVVSEIESLIPEVVPTETTPQTYVEELAKTKESDPETYWSVSEVSPEDAAKGTIIDTPDGSALVKPDGDIAGLFKKLTSKAKGVAQDLLNKAVEAGGIKLDNFDGYLTKQYEKAGFRIVSRVPFSLEYGVPDGYNKEKHGTPDVVAMVYDPNNELDIEEKTFEDYDEAMAYRDGFVDQARALTTEVNTAQELIDESEKSNDLPSLVEKAKNALSKILPGTKIVLYNTEAEYKAAINEGADENSGGAFVNGKIHINPNRANGRTVAHEVFHAILLNMVKSDPAAQRVTAAMITAIEKVLPPDMKAKLQDFVENGYDAQRELWDEEKLAELVGYLAENFSSLSQPAKNIIKQWLDQLAKLVGLKEFTDKEVIDFMNTISGKIASGEEITEKDVKILKPKTTGNLIKRFQANFTDPVSKVEFSYDKNTEDFKKLEKEGFITRDKSINDFNGQTIFLHQPDAAFSGEISKNGESLVSGKGGVYYPVKFHNDGFFWASTASTANKMAKDLNAARKANGGKLLMALTTAPSDKLLSSTTAANGVMEIVISKAFDKNFSINKTQVKNSLVDAANTSSVINGKKVGLGMNIKKGSTIEEVKSEIAKKLNPDKSSFADRKAFVEKLLSNVANIVKADPKAVDQFGKFFSEGIKNEAFKGKTKTGKLSISAANLKQGISEMLTEPMLKEGVDRNKGGQVYAILELNGDVNAVDSNKHESYPKAIQSADPNNKVTLHILKDRVKWNEVFEDPTTNKIVSKDRELNIFPTSGVSTTGLKLNTENTPGRKQIIGEKAVKDKLVQNNLDTAKKMEAENKSAEDIFIATGWEKGVDKKWKYDLQEGVVEIKSKKSGKASDVLNYPELFKAYPKAKDLDIVFMKSDKFEGMYLPTKNRIMISSDLSDSEATSTLLHEFQHFVQHQEGFAVGGQAKLIRDLYNERIKYEKNFSVKKILNNIKNSLFGNNKNESDTKKELDKLGKLVSKVDEDLYRSIAGEVEAFNVEKRATMTTEQRRATPISETADVPSEEQLVVSDSDTMLKDRKQANRPSVNKIYERSEKAIKDRNKSKSIKDLGPYLRKSLLDRQAYIKRLLDRIDNKSAKKAYDLLVTKAGASALAAERFKQAEKEIYGKLNSEDTKTLDKIIYARRIVAVNESRAELGMPAYTGMDGYSLDDAKQDLADFKQELGDKKFKDLNDRATTYFNVFKANLRKLYDSGRISKEVYESLRNTEYSPIKTIKYIIGDNLSPDEIDTQAKSLGISRKDIMKLSDSNENEIILDSKWLLAMNIGSVEGRAFENRMLNEFNKAIESATADEKKAFEEFVLDNPVVGKKKDGSLKYKYDDAKVPVGYTKVSFFENGNKIEIVLKDAYAKQLLDVKNKNTFLETIGKLTGTQILRFFATGGNPLFIIGNTAVDFQNIAFWSDTYSKFKPLAAAQLMRDFTKNFIKKAVMNNKYNAIFNEYINHGGALDYLSNDGLKALESMNPVKSITKQAQKGLLAYGRAMAFLGETSEVAFRLSVFEKVKEDSLKEFRKENGRELNFQEKEDILWKAAREARETMDFSQGGDVAKNIDAIFPYFNAALQGVRRPIDFATNNPAGFASSVLQYTAMAASLTAASLAMLIKSVRDDDDDDEEANKKILEALNSVSEYEKANYHILFTGNKNKDGEYEYYRVKKLPVLSVISTVGDQLIYNDFFKNVGIDYEIDEEAIKEAALKSNPLPITVQELAGKNPVASGLVSYWSNKDTFTGEKIFREPNNKKILPEAEGIFDDKVDQVYKDLAPGLGLSPIRTKVMIEKVITSENTNPTIPLIYSAYDGIFNKKDGLGNEASEAMSNVGKAFGKKLVRYTDKNIIRYKKQDEMEYKESVTETDIWKKEQKVYNEIKSAYKDGGSLTEEEFVNVIKKNFDPIDQVKYAKKYNAYIHNMNVDKSVLDIIFEDVPEVQAMKLNQRYGANLEDQEIKELEEAMRSSRRKVNKKAIYIYNEKYKNRKPAN